MDIKKAVRLLSPLMIEGVLSSRSHSHQRLIEMLHELEFVTRSISESDEQVVIELQILDVELLYRLLAGEANKFLLASMVSYERSTQNQLNNAAWQAIENYYAAYYGVHYLLRLTGTSVTNIDTRGLISIKRNNFGAQPAKPVGGGLYAMKYDDTSKTLTLTKNKKKKGGGSHQEAWQLWSELIEKLRVRTNIDPVEYMKLSIELSDHKRFLMRSTAKYNPPEIRGEINYQFIGGLWIFEKNSTRSIGILQRLIIADESAATSGTATPEGLISNNRIIIGMAKAVFIHTAQKYPKGICRALLNQYANYI